VGSRYDALVKRVFIGFPRADGEAFLAIKQSINDALTALVSTGRFDGLLKKDTTGAKTVADKKIYHLTEDLGLSYLKDIESIVLSAEGNSRKLTWVDPRELDEKIPYPERFGTGKPRWYTRYGDNIELIRIPNKEYPLHIRYSKWPEPLIKDEDVSPLGTQWDHILVFLAKDIANAYLNGEYINFLAKAGEYLKIGLSESRTRPDEALIAEPFSPTPASAVGEYWKNPFVKHV
jgi:hypothetical protein